MCVDQSMKGYKIAFTRFSLISFFFLIVSTSQASTLGLVSVWLPIIGFDDEFGIKQVAFLTNQSYPEFRAAAVLLDYIPNTALITSTRDPEDIGNINPASEANLSLMFDFYAPEGCFIKLDVSQMTVPKHFYLRHGVSKNLLLEAVIKALSKNLTAYIGSCSFDVVGIENHHDLLNLPHSSLIYKKTLLLE